MIRITRAIASRRRRAAPPSPPIGQVDATRSDAGLAAVLEAAVGGLVVLDADGVARHANRAAERILGAEPGTLAGRSLDDPIWTAMRGDCTPFDEGELPASVALRTGEPVHGVLAGIVRPDGAVAWLEVSAAPLTRADGGRPGVLVTLADVTDEHAARTAAERRAASYRALVASLPGTAVALFDRDLRYLLTDGPAWRGRPDGGPDLAGRRVLDPEVMTPEAIEETEPLYRAALAGETNRLRRARPDGTVYEVTVAPVRDGDEIVAGLAIAMDVTERARLEDEREALRAIAAAAATGSAPDALLPLVARRVAGLFGGVGAAVVRFDGDGAQTLVALEPEGLAGLHAGDAVGLPTGHVEETARAEVLHDLRALPHPLVEAMEARGAVGAVAAPIAIGRRVWGAIVLAGRDAGRLTDGTARRLGEFADVSAAAIASAEATAGLRDREAQFRAVVERSVDTIVRLLPDGTVAYVSPSVKALLGFAAEDVLGMRGSDLFHPDDRERRDELMATVDAARDDIVVLELRLRRADGGWEWVEVAARGVRDADGRLLERQATIRSVQRRREAEAEVRQVAARYRTLARSLPHGGVYLFDRGLRLLVAEGPTARGREDALLGATPDEALGADEGRPYTAAFRAALAGRTTRRTEWRQDGRIVDLTIAPVRDDDEVVAGIALELDVTERVRLGAEQDALREIAQAAAEDADLDTILALVVDRVGRLFGAVGAAVMRLDGDEHAVLAAASPTLLGGLVPGGRVDLRAARGLAAAVRTGTPSCTPRFDEPGDPLAAAMEQLGAVGGAVAPITINRRPWGMLVFGGADAERLEPETAARLSRFADLIATSIASAEAWAELGRVATTDALTGLPNRRAFDERLASEIARAQRRGHHLALLAIDVDRFKDVNDAHGHPVGDRVLVEVAAVLSAGARAGDLVARIGGDEFVWLLPYEDAASALPVAERLRASMAARRRTGLPQVTLSVGIAALGRDGTAADLVHRADLALYAAKGAGRDRVSA